MPGGSRVALALGSGGARGYAHIGVIAELEARGFTLVSVAGSSMGALVGGLYCGGGLDDYVRWASGLTQIDVMRLLDVSLSRQGGVIGAERVVARVRDILGDARIEDLAIPFTAVATDLGTGRSVWFQNGSLVDAIRASIAIPGVIAPHRYDGRLLADGGILDPLPVAPTSAVNSDVTIGVVLDADGGPGTGATRVPGGRDKDRHRESRENKEPREPKESREHREPKDKGIIRRNMEPLLSGDFVRSVRDRIGLDVPTVAPETADGPYQDMLDELGRADPAATRAAEPEVRMARTMGRMEVLSRSLDIMSVALTRHQIAGYPPDILIRVPRKAVRTLDFHKATEMIELGRTLTAEALDRLPEQS
ncbi:patatin-like phospholipase family protein [Gordonia sp. NB41Y]|uniref:patatin-like phospholipase family protein n=1 Tax=Gordonia sp. NB41Y TaxID=875808 RepID=UPI0006B16E08|nr:patatin-like phospholipase family protein [Gordonia sp. NB41Y]EMP11178.2 esterase [Gordonia sp. NB41Y]WLP91815.1 patatin-like phospholipase family protein [Gordonia sp. NB41Y]